MNTNLKKLTLAIMTVAMLFALALPAAAAEAPAHYDDDLFTWDEAGTDLLGSISGLLDTIC